QSLYGLDTLLRLLAKFGKRGFSTSYGYSQRRHDVLTHLIHVTYPRATDTLADFAAAVTSAVKAGTVPKQRVLELAFLAPQWLPHVEAYLGWPGLAEGVYWFLAHMPHHANTDTIPDFDKLVRARCAVREEDRDEGAVDGEWFRRVFAPLGR